MNSEKLEDIFPNSFSLENPNSTKETEKLILSKKNVDRLLTLRKKKVILKKNRTIPNADLSYIKFSKDNYHPEKDILDKLFKGNYEENLEYILINDIPYDMDPNRYNMDNLMYLLICLLELTEKNGEISRSGKGKMFFIKGNLIKKLFFFLKVFFSNDPIYFIIIKSLINQTCDANLENDITGLITEDKDILDIIMTILSKRNNFYLNSLVLQMIYNCIVDKGEKLLEYYNVLNYVCNYLISLKEGNSNPNIPIEFTKKAIELLNVLLIKEVQEKYLNSGNFPPQVVTVLLFFIATQNNYLYEVSLDALYLVLRCFNPNSLDINNVIKNNENFLESIFMKYLDINKFSISIIKSVFKVLDEMSVVFDFESVVCIDYLSYSFLSRLDLILRQIIGKINEDNKENNDNENNVKDDIPVIISKISHFLYNMTTVTRTDMGAVIELKGVLMNLVKADVLIGLKQNCSASLLSLIDKIIDTYRESCIGILIYIGIVDELIIGIFKKKEEKINENLMLSSVQVLGKILTYCDNTLNDDMNNINNGNNNNNFVKDYLVSIGFVEILDSFMNIKYSDNLITACLNNLYSIYFK